jgi:hypothetical protein
MDVAANNDLIAAAAEEIEGNAGFHLALHFDQLMALRP